MGTWKTRNKKTGQYWTGAEWAPLVGEWNEQKTVDLDDDTEMVELTPAPSTHDGAAMGILKVTHLEIAKAAEAPALDAYQPYTSLLNVVLFPGMLFHVDSRENRDSWPVVTKKVSYQPFTQVEVYAGSNLILLADGPGIQGNLRAGACLQCDDVVGKDRVRVKGVVIEPGFAGGRGQYVPMSDRDRVAQGSKALEALLGPAAAPSVADPHAPGGYSDVHFVCATGQEFRDKCRDYGLPMPSLHPVSREQFKNGYVNRHVTAEQDLVGANGNIVRTPVGGDGMTRGFFTTATGHFAEGYVDGGVWRWTAWSDTNGKRVWK